MEILEIFTLFNSLDFFTLSAIYGISEAIRRGIKIPENRVPLCIVITGFVVGFFYGISMLDAHNHSNHELVHVIAHGFRDGFTYAGISAIIFMVGGNLNIMDIINIFLKKRKG